MRLLFVFGALQKWQIELIVGAPNLCEGQSKQLLGYEYTGKGVAIIRSKVLLLKK